MRDEPEMRNCFQCEVSLNMSQAKKGILLVNDYSHEEFGTAELGRDAGIRPGQPEVNLVPRRSSSHLWFYRGSAEGPAVPALEPRSTRRGASVPDEGQRIEPGPDHAAHRRLDADAAGAETTTPTAQFSPAVLQRRCGLAGRGGRRSRGAIRASHPSHSGVRVQRLRQGRVRRAVGHFGFPHLQPAPFQDLSTVPGARAAHPTQSGVHCRAAQTRPPREARLPARGYGTSGSARWPAGAVSSQCRRHRDPVGDRGLRGDHQRAAPAAGVGGHAAPVPLSHFGVSLRQRVRVHQPPSGRSAEPAVGGVHQITGLPHHRQRFSGRQEWRGRAQAYRVWTDRRAACRGTAEILHGPFQPLLELPPALWLCGQRAGGRRQKETDLSDRGLSNALRETDFAARLAAVLEGGTAPGSAATTGRPDERHRGCAADEKSQAGRVGEMPGKAVRRSDNRRLRAQGLYVLGRERGAQAPPPFPAPYPPLTGAYRKEKVSGRNATLLSRTCPGSSRIGNKLWLRAHLALESKFISRLIYGLENAGCRSGPQRKDDASKATAGLSLLSKLAQHFRRVQAPAFRRRQSRPQPLEHLRQRSLVEDLEALDIEAVKLPFTRFGARPSSSAMDAYRRAEDVLRKVAHDRFRGHAAVNWVAGPDVNVDRFIAPADLNHLGHPEYPARRSGQ